jgi:hypothetical protein
MSDHGKKNDLLALEPSVNRANSLGKLLALAMSAGDREAAAVATYELVDTVGVLHHDYHVALKKAGKAAGRLTGAR